MSQDVNFFTRALDRAYHSRIYQQNTEHGPLRMPDSTGDRAIEETVNDVKKTTGFFLDIMRKFLPDDRDNQDPFQEAKEQVNHLHVPTARNWTRATNGVLQGVGVLGLSVLCRSPYYGRSRTVNNLFIVGAIGWGFVGARHLNQANYSNDQDEYYWRNSKFIWSKKGS